MTNPTVAIALLGGWQLASNRDNLKQAPRLKVKALLAYLAVESNQAHSRELLAGLLWPEMGKAKGRNNLRVTLSALKKLVNSPELIETTRTTVAFNTAVPHTLDLTQFETLIKQTEAHGHASLAQCDGCLADLETAVSLYQGDFLAGLSLAGCDAFDEWHFVWRERLHVLALNQLGRLAGAMMENGRYAEAERYGRRQVELDALHEAGHRQLMHALFAQGNRAAALQQYQTCATVLQAELGVLPDSETEQLKTAIAQNQTLRPQTSQQSEAPKYPPSNLPKNLAPFIGREEELTLLSERFQARTYRLISLVGPGGIGKTRLSIEAGRQQQDLFQDGIYFVSLVGVQSAHNVPSAVADAIGLLLIPAGASPAEQVADYLARREILLIIDNLEHLIEAVVDLLLNWLEKSEKLVLLVTSRERLNVQSEDLFRLKGLPYPAEPTDPMANRYEAVRLFGDRAHRLNKQFWLNEDTLADVVRLCQRVEGLPLALELAATFVREYTVGEITTILAEQPDLLETDLRDIPARHRRIEAVFDFSWRLLSDAEKEILPRLSLFRGGFTQDAAREVAGASPVTVTRLRYKSLVRVEGNGHFGKLSAGRFSMHELTRQMAERKLRHASQQTKQARLAHAAYFLNQVKTQAPLLVGVDAARTATLLKLDLDNIRAAWQTAAELGESDLLQKSAAALVDFYLHSGIGYDLDNVLAYVETVYNAQNRPVPVALQRQLDLLKLSLPTMRENPTAFQPLFNSFLARLKSWRGPGKRLFEAKAHYYASLSLGYGKDAQNSTHSVIKALELAYEADDLAHLGEVLCAYARAKFRFKQFDEAISVLQEAMTIFEQLGHLKGMAKVEGTLAPAIAEGGNPWEAVKHDLRSLELYQQLGDERNIPRGHFNAYLSYATFGAYEKAYWHAKQCATLYKKIGDESGVFLGISGMADVEMMWGNYDTAVDLFKQCLAFRKENEEYERYCFEGLDAGRCLEMAGLYAEGLSLIDDLIPWLEKFEYEADVVAAKVIKALLLFKMGEKEAGLTLGEQMYHQINWDTMMEPLKTSYELFTLFDQANHPFAKATLQFAYTYIANVAASITDPERHASYLRDDPYCRWLRAKFEPYGFTDFRLESNQLL